MRETALWIGYIVMVAVPATIILLVFLYARIFRPARRGLGWAGFKLDRGLRLFFEFFFGPMETWRLYRWRARRAGIDL